MGATGPRTPIGIMLCSVMLLCFVFIPATLQAQQPSPVTLAVEAGFEGNYRVNQWFPVRVTVTNDGPDIRGWLEWRFPNQPTGRFRQEIDLPQGSRKQVTLAIVTDDYFRNGQVVLVNNGADVARQNVQLEGLDADQLLAVVVSNDGGLLNSLTGMQPAGFRTALVSHLDLAALPDQPQLLQTATLLFLHDRDTSALSAPQRRALQVWVELGGTLVVSGGSRGVSTAAGVAELLPVEVGDGFVQASLAPLATVGSQADSQLPDDTTTNQVTAREGSEAIAAGANQPALIYQWARGSGSVTFSTFDLAALRGWNGEAALWERVLQPMPRMSLGGVSRQQQFTALSDVLRLGALTLLPIPAVLGLLALYILAIGPLNYFLLKRLNRLNLAWLTIPLVVFGFVGGIYLTGRLLRGNETRLSQVTIVQASEGSDQAMFTAYHGLFSPNRERYTLGAAPGALLDELRSFDDPGDSGSAVVTTDQGTELRDTLVNIGAIRIVMSESIGATNTGVSSDLRLTGTRLSGELQYQGGLLLEDAMIVRDRSVQTIGDLAPGSTTQVDLDTTNTDFPWSLSLEEQNAIDRQQLLVRLADISEYNQGFTTPGAVYLFGWHHQPSVDLTVNNTPGEAEGVTLYVIKLRG